MKTRREDGGKLSQADRYKQQRGKPYRPDMSPANLWPYYACGAVIFLGMGVCILIVQAQLEEIHVDYTNCTTPRCYRSFTLPQSRMMKGPIFIYYRLQNFHQNHRSYVDSRDDRQLSGGRVNGTDCPGHGLTDKPTLPCGDVANSAFSDVIGLHMWTPDNQGRGVRGRVVKVPLINTTIAFPRERHAYTKVKNDPDLDEKIKKPKDWSEEKWGRFLDKGYDEDLMVWMRTAALQDFRKLWRKVDHSAEPFKEGLPKNKKYKFSIENKFNVTSINARKSLIIAQQSFLGAKSDKKCWISLAVGAFLAVSAIVLRNLAKLEESVAM